MKSDKDLLCFWKTDSYSSKKHAIEVKLQWIIKMKIAK